MSWTALPKMILKAPVMAAFRAWGHFPVRIRGTPYRVNPDHLAFWRQVSRGRWEADTFDVLERFLTPGSIFIDVGAWIGPLTIFAATRSRRVYSIEPDYDAYRCLLMNLELNRLKNVIPFQVAVGARTGVRSMSVVGGQMGNSRTRMADVESGNDQFEVAGLSWSDWLKLAGPETPSLIKIDIEGGEFELLPAMKEYLSDLKPPLLLSVHLPFLPEEKRDLHLAALRDVLSTYGKCLDEKMRPMGHESALGAVREQVQTLLLMD